MKKSCATCALSKNGMPGRCNYTQCMAGNFSSWSDKNAIRTPPEDTTCLSCKNGPRSTCKIRNSCKYYDKYIKATPVKESEETPVEHIEDLTEFIAEEVCPLAATPEDPPIDDKSVKKADLGKTDMSLLEYFPLALEALCKQSEAGCVKYARGSFKDVPDARRRYTAAMLRHYFQEGPGDTCAIDEETGLEHDIATMWNAVCRVELRLRGFKLDSDTNH